MPLNSTKVYTRWQASWRSGLGLGVVVAGAVLLLSVSMAFRLGFRLSGRSHVGLNEVAECRQTLRWSGRVIDKVPSSHVGVHAARLTVTKDRNR
jgi:hypothetical protein